MIRAGRLTKKQKKAIEDIFYEKRYKVFVDVVSDLVEIGLKHIDEFDGVDLGICTGRPKSNRSETSPLEEEGTYFKFKSDVIKAIEQLKQQRKIRDYTAIIRKLIEIGLNHRDELPNSSA